MTDAERWDKVKAHCADAIGVARKMLEIFRVEVGEHPKFALSNATTAYRAVATLQIYEGFLGDVELDGGFTSRRVTLFLRRLCEDIVHQSRSTNIFDNILEAEKRRAQAQLSSFLITVLPK
jgi:hypothetical protein